MRAETAAVQTPKGNLWHLVRTGEHLTLCGKRHGLNPEYIPGRFTREPAAATCSTCRRAAS